jgi:hypothetical protein
MGASIEYDPGPNIAKDAPFRIWMARGKISCLPARAKAYNPIKQDRDAHTGVRSPTHRHTAIRTTSRKIQGDVTRVQ